MNIIDLMTIETAFANAVSRCEVRKASYADKEAAQLRYSIELQALSSAINEMADKFERTINLFDRTKFIEACMAISFEQRSRLFHEYRLPKG